MKGIEIMVADLRLRSERETESSKRVLLLEDDEQFAGILREFLQSNSYDVVSVESGADGVREIMAADFDAIVCDMMMPGLPGDMFYFAVERMRPALCMRFIFMTGLQGSDRLNQFISRINGTMLPKPFHVDDLLEMIGFVQVKAAYSSN